MKISSALLPLLVVSMVACGKSSRSNGSSGPVVRAQDAAGSLDGTLGQFARGFFVPTADSTGYVNSFAITLTANGMSDCNWAAQDPTNVQITTPAPVGTYTAPKASVAFSYNDLSGHNVFTFSNSLVVQVTSYDGKVLHGGISAVAGTSHVNGTFVATQCPSATVRTPTGIADPSQAAPVVASDWSSTSYAFCSAGSTAILVDFEGANFSNAMTGAVRVATRSCNSGMPYSWIVGKYQMMKTTSGAMVNFTLPNGKFGIQTTSAGATGFYNTAAATCTLLMNEGTQGLSNCQ